MRRNLQRKIAIFYVVFMASCQLENSERRDHDLDFDSLQIEINQSVKLPDDFLDDWNDSTFQLEFHDVQSTVSISTISKF